MEIENYDPMKVLQDINRTPGDIITANRWNELWTLIITQGDHTADWLLETINKTLYLEDWIIGLVEGDIPPGSITEHHDQSLHEDWKDLIYRFRIYEGKLYLEVVEDGGE